MRRCYKCLRYIWQVLMERILELQSASIWACAANGMTGWCSLTIQQWSRACRHTWADVHIACSHIEDSCVDRLMIWPSTGARGQDCLGPSTANLMQNSNTCIMLYISFFYFLWYLLPYFCIGRLSACVFLSYSLSTLYSYERCSIFCSNSLLLLFFFFRVLLDPWGLQLSSR